MQQTYTVKIEKFEGPFGLLLELIQTEKLSITEIALADVTEQYLHHLETVEQLYPEELADFLVVATRLLLLKSRALLPVPEQEEDPEELMSQLKMFKRYSEATKHLEARLNQNTALFARQFGKVRLQTATFQPPQNFGTTQLHTLFVQVLHGLEPIVKIPKAAIARAVSLKEKINALRDLLEHRQQISFRELMAIDTSADRTDVIVTFLAMLELVKQRQAVVQQKKSFDDIIVSKFVSKV